MKILLTGSAGFIGFHVARRLLERGDWVIGVDNLNSYYDVALKHARNQQLLQHDHYSFVKLDIADRQEMAQLFARENFTRVVHLAAQAGVRASIEQPHIYIDSNIVGFLNILEGCRQQKIEHLVYASSSSVYGANRRYPLSEHHSVDHPLSLYAASKRANELMAHTYSNLFALPTTGLRFFTVYGPWGRPDMALFSFTQKILSGESIPVFNYGKHRRDFTYIDDIVTGVISALDVVPTADPAWSAKSPDPASSFVPYRLYNIGGNCPIELTHTIDVLEKYLEKTAVRDLLPMQPGDVEETWADTTDLAQDFGFSPQVSIEDGIARFVDWYLSYYQVKTATNWRSAKN